ATLTLEWSAEPGVSSVPSDPVRLQSVLAKLIDNAIKFTPGGRVDVRAFPGEGTQGPRIEVADTGEGIRPDLIETIFAPFQQGEDFSRRQHGGTGLGLHLARRQCRMMRCRLTVASTEGQGTTFTIAFPAPAA
ncbi:MAG: ATP-binding protein, partial [Gemmatimonadaceae bacterium]